MAAPSDQKLPLLSGKYQMNKTLSDSAEPILALQGIGWVTRKAINAAGLSLVFSHQNVKPTDGTNPDAAVFEPLPAPSEDGECVQLHFDQVVTGGLKGTAETRILDGKQRGHTDWLFGTVDTQNLLRSHADVLALSEPYLAGPEGDKKENKNKGAWLDEGVHVWSRGRSANGWVATQVWGFQMITINGKQERRFCRNIVVTKGKDKVKVWMVYDFVPQA